MKKILVLCVLIFMISCKNESKKEAEQSKVKTTIKESFPNELGEVFKKHGGIENWRKIQLLSFNKGEEVHTADLYSRKTVINSPKYSLGFDGKNVWLDEEVEGSFKGNPEFYYNLYFYFYAMPFVLADDGITYDKVPAISFDDIEYPGYKISYEANIGSSPEDNYIIYYHPNTYQMEWLAYTVTFNSKKPSEKYSIIRYNKWENTNGIVLPKEITWYKKDDNGNPTTPARPATEFTLPLLSEVSLGASFFEKPQ
ncbi:DUF6503 family protein [uncultured Polaribacter sp.]|uniref:DUF6503 family protein n=1 Tax=uncultured Polaribacter sp. TaxID=174711 RepID=UPI002623EFC8|nr:DUF6503 family protein [uncultured Polaribacter sp.]